MQQDFWNKIAAKYAAGPVKDQSSYEFTLERTRHYLSSQSLVVEFGAGTGSTSLLLAQNARQIICTDFSDAMIEIARRKISDAGVDNIGCKVGSFELMDQSGEPYDTAIAFNVLHLIEDLVPVYARIFENLKPGGHFISKSGVLAGKSFILKPIIWVMQKLGKAPYINFLSSDDLENGLVAAGFKIVESSRIPEGSTNHFIVARKPN